MSYLIKCQSCGQVLRMSDSLFTGRIQGNLVAVRCRHCKAPMAVDGQATTELTSPVLFAPEAEEDVEYSAPDGSWRAQALHEAAPLHGNVGEHEGETASVVSSRAPVSERASTRARGVRYVAIAAGLCALGVYASTQVHGGASPARVIQPIVETNSPSHPQPSTAARAPESATSAVPLVSPESPVAPLEPSVTPGEVVAPKSTSEASPQPVSHRERKRPSSPPRAH